MQGASRESLARLREELTAAVDGANADAVQQLMDELFAVVTLLAGQPSLRRALSDPALEADRKVGLVDRLIGRMLGEPTLDLVRSTARRRWSQPIDVVDALENLAVETALVRAERARNLDEVEDELFRFERILAAEPALRAALTNRVLPDERKRRLLAALLEGKVAPVTMTLVERAVLAPRGRTIEGVLADYTSLAARRRERLLARVTTAVELDAPQQERLAEALQASYGHEVRLQVIVDPSLIGGLTVRIGDEVLDGSVARQLGEARRRLTGS